MAQLVIMTLLVGAVILALGLLSQSRDLNKNHKVDVKSAIIAQMTRIAVDSPASVRQVGNVQQNSTKSEVMAKLARGAETEDHIFASSSNSAR